MKKEKNKIIFGIHAVTEAIKSGTEIYKLMLCLKPDNRQIKNLLNIARETNVLVQFVPVEKLNRITGKNHQGAVAFLSEIIFHKIEHVIPELYENGLMPLILILDEITDVRNFGAIARTAECSGVNAIVVPEKNSAEINSFSVKASSGALLTIPVCRVKSLKQTVLYLKNSGLKIFTATEKGNKTIYEADFSLPSAIVLGSEDTGINPEILKCSDENIYIPMAGKIESLNVSVAAGVILFEAVRKRITVLTKIKE